MSHLAAFADDYIKAYREFFPTEAASSGRHEYDGRMPDFSRSAVARRLADLRRFEEQLAALPSRGLTAQEAQDRELLRLALLYERFTWEEQRRHLSDPVFYAFSGALDVSDYVKRDYAPLGQRVEALLHHARQMPDFVATMLDTLEPALPRPHLHVAQDAVKGLINFWRNELAPNLAQAPASLNREVDAVAQAVIASLERLADHIEQRLLPQAHDDFALGADRYAKLLRYGEGVDEPLERLLAIGYEELARNKAAMAAAAARIDPQASAEAVNQRLAGRHPSEETLVGEVQSLLSHIQDFLLARRLVTIPDQTLCQVFETPSFMRFGFAMMDTPGVFDSLSLPSIYYVTPVLPDWSEQEKREWLSQFAYHTLQLVSIHEAYPGHYVHYQHFRQSPSEAGLVFSAYSFWEGWAHYTEQMMVEQGYGDGDPALALAQASEALVRTCRYIVSIQMHTQGMTVDEAAAFFEQHSRLAPLPAREEAARGAYDPGYVNYTLGKLMLLKLLEDARQERGGDFDLQAFHDEFLSYGAPPIPLVRRRMLGNGRGNLL